MDNMRKEFEEWHIKQCEADGMDWRDISSELDRDGDGYVYTGAQYAWRGWKASRSELCIELPEVRVLDGGVIAEIGYEMAISDFEKALDKSGVTYK